MTLAFFSGGVASTSLSCTSADTNELDCNKIAMGEAFQNLPSSPDLSSACSKPDMSLDRENNTCRGAAQQTPNAPQASSQRKF
mmetsp:Transcript_49692/g.89251  ORF Transcript_49692/g.89251 Transcript_49692/m.89251 type:complete len:83 (-) Transcript_49692:1104-1352(-)